jgi:hypothetical protein
MNPHYNYYISNKGLLWECDKEDVEVGTISLGNTNVKNNWGLLLLPV